VGETFPIQTYSSIPYHQKKDGTIFPVEISASSFRQNERIVNLVTIRDISERRRVEKEREALLAEVQGAHAQLQSLSAQLFVVQENERRNIAYDLHDEIGQAILAIKANLETLRLANESAALAEPLSCAINAQELAGVRTGDRVLILGGGPLGALHAVLAKALGASEVMVVQRSEPRLSMLKSISGLTVIDGAREDVAQVVSEKTSGLGADVVIVCAPSKEAQEESLKFARKGGAISLFASLPKGEADITLDSRAIHYSELRIVGASDSRQSVFPHNVQYYCRRFVTWDHV
jgi:NADPH:quinone reductase-like Zn-dependent oxidoreductase